MRRLLLITASSPEIRRIRRSRVINFQQITMPYLAAWVSSAWEVWHVDEDVQPVDLDADVDLVGITFHTPSAHHAYYLASQFRGRGIFVALGGPHVTLMPEEAAAQSDAIFIGEAEGLWQSFLKDFEEGCCQRVYRQTTAPRLADLPMARKDLFHRRDHAAGVLFASRGCPNRCDFCAITVMYANSRRNRPVHEVAAEYASFNGKVIIFWDDNIAGDLAYAKELFKAIAPYRKWWSSQASVQAGQDDEFLELAARSGCKQLFLGWESISQDSVNEVHKGFNRVTEYEQVIRRIHSHGISVQVGIIFGFDSDARMVFRDTLDFLEQVGVDNATFNMLTPYPGTRLFKKMEREGRILTRDWSKYNGRVDVVFQPTQMSCAELLAGFKYANARFYSYRSIVRRLSRSRVQLWWTLPLNMAYCLALTVSLLRKPRCVPSRNTAFGISS